MHSQHSVNVSDHGDAWLGEGATVNCHGQARGCRAATCEPPSAVHAASAQCLRACSPVTVPTQQVIDVRSSKRGGGSFAQHC